MKCFSNDVFFAWVESEIAEGRPVRFRLKGQSMFPLLRNERDMVVLYPCREEELSSMDVVLFRYQGRHILHRILRREGTRLYLRGDGSYIAKEECFTADVIGKVHEIIYPSGKVISVDSWQWRLISRLWCRLGFIRNPCLKILHKLFN